MSDNLIKEEITKQVEELKARFKGLQDYASKKEEEHNKLIQQINNEKNEIKAEELKMQGEARQLLDLAKKLDVEISFEEPTQEEVSAGETTE